MITKGYILDYSITSKNRFKVRIPYFESAGIGKNHSYTQSVFEDVPVSYSPGNIAGFKIGDCVYIAFEDSSFDKPVIIGKLYLGKEKEASNYQFSSVLEVTQRATLPKNTSFGGDLTLEDILELGKQITLLTTELATMWKKISAVLQVPTPTITLDGDTLTITDDSGIATTFDILINGTVRETISTTTFDLSTLKLTEGDYNIIVIAKADGYIDSEVSNTIKYTSGLLRILLIIDNVSYNAEAGMTWSNWVNSNYNINGYAIDINNNIENSSGDILVDNSGNLITSDMEIVADATYTTVSYTEVTNEYGTTLILNSNEEEANEYGTTLVI